MCSVGLQSTRLHFVKLIHVYSECETHISPIITSRANTSAEQSRATVIWCPFEQIRKYRRAPQSSKCESCAQNSACILVHSPQLMQHHFRRPRMTFVFIFPFQLRGLWSGRARWRGTLFEGGEIAIILIICLLQTNDHISSYTHKFKRWEIAPNGRRLISRNRRKKNEMCILRFVASSFVHMPSIMTA